MNHPPNVFGMPKGSLPTPTPSGAAHHPAPGLPNPFQGAVPPPAKPPLDWEAILDRLPYGLIVLDPGQDLLYENVGCRQLMGFGVAERGGVEGWLSALCPDPGHRQKVISSWREHIWRNQLTRTFTLRTAAQKLKEIEFRSSLLRDGGISLTIEDVTEDRRTEETLRHGKLKFRALFSHSETGTVLVDRTGRIIDANPAFVSLTGILLKDLRLSTLSELLHPEDAAELAVAEETLAKADTGRPGAERAITRDVRLRTRTSEMGARLTFCPIGESPDRPAMGIYLFSVPVAAPSLPDLAARLKSVSAKAQALFQAIPDLILLIDSEGRIADYAPPARPWTELSLDESWHGKRLGEVWPVFDNLYKQCSERIRRENKAVHADIRSRGRDGFDFAATLSPCGDGQVLAVVRNHSEKNTPRESDRWEQTSPATAFQRGSPGPAPRPSDRVQHGFRNQLQLVTSLFSLEPQGVEARSAFLRWQVRLRSIALACPYGESSAVEIFPLLRSLADEVCSLTGRGFGRRTVVITGREDLEIDAQIATPFGLLIGELMRLVLSTRQQGHGPELYIHLGTHGDDEFQLTVRPGADRRFLFENRETEVETLELLTEQIQGRLRAADPENPSREWTLVVPSRPR